MGTSPGRKGEFDWIVSDPEIDFAALFARFDTLLVGRGTFEFMVKHGQATVPGMKIIVFSRTLPATRRSGRDDCGREGEEKR